MKIRKPILLAAVLWLAAACGSSSAPTDIKSINNHIVAEVRRPEGTRKVQWRRPIVRTLMEAQQSQKVMVMYFHLDGCPYCAMMERSTFQDPRVIQDLNEWFMPVWLNIEEHLGNAVALGISATPATVFLTPNGTHIVTIHGVIPPSDFLKVLDVVDEYAKGEKQGPGIRAILREPKRKEYQL